MSRDINANELKTDVNNLIRRGEFDEMASDEAENEANAVGRLILQESELSDEDVNELIDLLSVSEEPVTDDEAATDLGAVRDKLRVSQSTELP